MTPRDDVRRPSVLLVVDALVGGGAEQQVVDLGCGLAERGWSVQLACSCLGPSGQDPQRAVDALARSGVRIHVLLGRLVKRRLSIPYALQLRRLLTAHAYHLVHAHIYASELAAALALAGRRTPLVVTEHTEGPWRGRRARLASHVIYRRSDSIVAVSRAIRHKLLENYGVSESHIRVLLPVGRTEPRPPTKPRPSELPAPPLVGFVGRLQPEKGVDLLLQALPQVLTAVPAANLVIVGDGPDRAGLEALTRRLGVTRSVTFLGAREDAAALLPWFDIVTVPSRTDGTPLVGHEAMLAGVPVVGSATGGIIDRLDDGRAGLLVPPGDPTALADAVTSLLRNPTERQRLGEAGRRAAASSSFTAMLDAYEDLYLGLLPTPLGCAPQS